MTLQRLSDTLRPILHLQIMSIMELGFLVVALSIMSLLTRIKISVNTDISVIGFYGNIGKISMDIFIKISVIKIFYILII